MLNLIDVKSKLFYCRDFKNAVEYALDYTMSRETCLFSPAAASYDQFKSFEERGNVFKELVLKAAKK